MNVVKRLLLGDGLLSDALRRELSSEGITFAEEGITGSISYRRFNAPGAYYSREIFGTAGAIVVTARRLVVWTSRGPHRGKHINVPLANRRPVGIDVHSARPGRITFGYDPARFHRDRSGRVEIRLNTPSAGALAQRLNSV